MLSGTIPNTKQFNKSKGRSLTVRHLACSTGCESCMSVHGCCFGLEKVQNCVLFDAVVCSILELRQGSKSDCMFLPLNNAQTGGL